MYIIQINKKNVFLSDVQPFFQDNIVLLNVTENINHIITVGLFHPKVLVKFATHDYT